MNSSSNATADASPLLSPSDLGSALSWFKETFGAVLIGSWFMVALYGTAISQTYYYFRKYTDDPLWTKGLVSIFWALNTLHTIITCYAAYHYLLTEAFNADGLLSNNWSLSASVAVHICITCFFFAYFVWLAYKLCKHKYRHLLAIGLALPALAHVALGFLTAARMHQAALLTDYENFSDTVMIPMATTQVVSDLLLSLVLCILLKQQRSPFKRTNEMIGTLVIFAISRGLLTAALALVELLATVQPSSLWYGAVEFIIAGLYINSLLVTLNSRRRIRAAAAGGANHADDLSYSLPLSSLTSEGRSFSTDSARGGHGRGIGITKNATNANLSREVLEIKKTIEVGMEVC